MGNIINLWRGRGWKKVAKFKNEGLLIALEIREIIIKLMREINEEDDDRNFEVISNFIFAIKQEKLNPALLPFEKKLFEELSQMITEQLAKLKDFLNYEDDYEVKVSNKNFKYMIYNS
jgi:predicted RNA-binding protein (virulence factor B family)